MLHRNSLDQDIIQAKPQNNKNTRWNNHQWFSTRILNLASDSTN